MTERRDPGSAAPGRSPLVIAHLSDPHLGAHVPATIHTLVTDVAAAAPQLVVVTGDWTMRARTGQFRQARELLDQLPAPRLAVLGNHDVPFCVGSRALSPYARYRNWIVPDLNPRVELSGLRALGLESMPRWRWKGGRVSGRQAGWVVEALGGAAPGVVRLLALHHPPLAAGRGRIVGRTGLMRALAAARVDLVLAGHTHIPSTQSVDLVHAGVAHRLVEVVAGTATSRRTRGTARSWSVIRIDRASIVVEERYERLGSWSAGRVVRYDRRTE